MSKFMSKLSSHLRTGSKSTPPPTKLSPSSESSTPEAKSELKARSSWEEIAKQQQERRDASIVLIEPAIPVFAEADLPLDVTGVPKTILTEEELRITESDAEDLLAQIAAKELTSFVVVKAFLRRAGLAQKLTNCLTDMLTTTALERAAYLDKYLEENGKPVGPLHGLPISVKEHINMADLTTNAGFISWHDRVSKENAHILDVLYGAGAIFYVRTTQPQTLMHLETDSNINGVTVNPFNRNLTCGGSSGGEGALIGLRGSCLGIGTDIGGSIRSPAANNGLFGLRPTTYRLPMEGFSATMLGEEQVVPVVGPLSTSLGGIKIFMKSIIDAKPWFREPSLIPMPWKSDSQLQDLEDGGKKLKVAVLYDDGVVRPHAPILRALKEVADKLQAVPGVEVVEWTPYKHDEAWTIISSLYFCDGGSEEAEAMDASGEPWRPLSKFILTENPNVKKLTVKEVWEWTVKRETYKAKYASLWGDVDVILCPTGPGAAPPHDCSRYWGYTSQWNLLDYPSLVAPFSKVDPAVDVKDEEYKPRNEKDQYNYDLYEPEKYVNAPISLQLVGRRYEDEKVCEAMEYIMQKVGAPWATYL